MPLILSQNMYDLGKARKSKAFFYKIRARDLWLSIHGSSNEAAYFSLNNNDELIEAKNKGVIYNPSRHTWQANLSWVLGLLHTEREIIINSEILPKNIFRSGFKPAKGTALELKMFSAFAREIATVIKIGYNVNIQLGLPITLSSSELSSEFLKSLTLDNIDPSKESIIDSLKGKLLLILNETGATHKLLFSLNNYILEEDPLINSLEKNEVDLNDVYMILLNDESLNSFELIELLNIASALTEAGYLYSSEASLPPKLCAFKQAKEDLEAQANPMSLSKS